MAVSVKLVNPDLTLVFGFVLHLQRGKRNNLDVARLINFISRVYSLEAARGRWIDHQRGESVQVKSHSEQLRKSLQDCVIIFSASSLLVILYYIMCARVVCVRVIWQAG